jgi:hypothetical protein
MAGVLELLVGPVTGLLDKFIPDADTKVKLAHEIATMAENQHHAVMMKQIEVNLVEASSKSFFKSGWRPAVGWVCVVGMVNNFIIMPYATALSASIQPMDWDAMLPILLGLLGLGGMRTLERVKGKA